MESHLTVSFSSSGWRTATTVTQPERAWSSNISLRSSIAILIYTTPCSSAGHEYDMEAAKLKPDRRPQIWSAAAGRKIPA